MSDHKSSNPFIASNPISIIPYTNNGLVDCLRSSGVRQIAAEEMTLASAD